MAAISNVIEDALFAAQTDSETVRPEVLFAHAKILEAIRSSDAEAAERRMSKHLRAYRERAAHLHPPEELPLAEPGEGR
jgi:DNA-binding FadR family transcriptional regulator